MTKILTMCGIIAFTFVNLIAQTVNTQEKNNTESKSQERKNDEKESLADDDEGDSDIEEADPDWNLSAVFKFQNRRLQNGLDVNSQRASHNTGVSLSHSSGLTASFDMTRLVNPNELSNYGFGLDYVYSVNDHLDFGATLNSTKYANDTISAFAGSNANLSIYLDYITKIGTFDFSYDKYFGTDDIQFVSLSYINSYTWGDFRLQPNISVSAGEYSISSSRLAKALSKKKAGKIIAVNKTSFGLTSFVIMLKLKYDLGKGFSLALAPAYNLAKDETGQKFVGEPTAYLSINYNYEF